MAKDPAVLWYWNDWNGGTSTLTRHQKGCYMDLLHAQFNSGPLSFEQIKAVLGQDQAVWTVLSSKFKKVNEGNQTLYLNARLETEKLRRAKYSESRKKNFKGNPEKKPHMDAHMGEHMETAIETETVFKDRGMGEGLSWDAEKVVNENQIQFERICMAANKSRDQASLGLRKYHLYLTEKSKYPMNRKQIFAGFEKWLLNEKSNGTHQQSSSRSSKNAGAIDLLDDLKADLRADG